MEDHQLTRDDVETAGELTDVCAQIVFKYLYLARVGRPHILWTVHALARAVTKWNSACGRRLTRLISYLECTSSHRQCCLVGDEASA